MGIEDEKVDQIIEAHTEVTDALKKELSEAQGWKAKHDEAAAALEKARGGEDWKLGTSPRATSSTITSARSRPRRPRGA